jgi:dipeptidyl aminopeptidase/acylaminoacyl peptidase
MSLICSRGRPVRCLPRVALVLTLVVAQETKAQAADPVAATRIALQKAKTQAAKQPRAAVIARETYLSRQRIVEVRLSPDGRQLSFLERGDKGFNVMLQNVSSGAQTRIAAGLQRVETAWAGDGRRLWVADEQGLAVVESPGLSAKRVLKWDSRTKQRLWTVDARTPRYAIIHERLVRAGAERHRYLSVDDQGKTRLLVEAALPLRSALLTADGALAFVAAFDGSRYETVIRQYTAVGSRELLRCGSLEECRLVGYDQARKTLWMLSQHDEDRLALRRWQQASGRWETVHRDPAAVADADEVLWSAARENWLAIAYHGGRRRWHGNDSRTRALLDTLQERLPDANLQLSSTADGGLWLVQAQQSDMARDRFYLYRPEENKLQLLFARERAAEGAPRPGAVMHPVSYRARDGMLLHGYVLLPNGVAPHAAPLIAWLHGGPIARVHDQYEGSMQLLVNRGYAVFVPNFRASAGYGVKYVLSANGDVGNGRVLTDIIDGLDFLLALGIGDRERQAVMGMSFGGYASLLALSHHPGRFRFAFAGAPPTEYGWIKEWQAEHDSEALRPEGPPLSVQFPQLGFRYQDPAWREKMRRESPLAALRGLQAPAYIWAGARDDHVPLKSIVNYVGEARRLGKPLSLLIDPDGGHGPNSVLGTQACLYLIELAAHRHFGGGLSPVSPELQAFLRRNVRIDTDARG